MAGASGERPLIVSELEVTGNSSQVAIGTLEAYLEPGDILETELTACLNTLVLKL